MSRGESREGRPQGRTRENRDRQEREGGGVPMGSLGTWLRTQREARGVSIRDIAEATKISQRYLEALERDRFDALPAEVFVRGFLREYARIVGLDPDEVVNVYLLAAAQARPVADEEPGVVPAGAARRASVVAYGVAVAALLIALLGAAAAISYWLGRDRGEDLPTSRVDAASRQPTTVRRPPVEPERTGALPEEPDAEVGSEEALPAPRPPAAEPPSPAAGGAPPAEGSPAAPAQPEPLRVVLEFQQDCWVELVVDGRRRESELKAGGETWAIEAQDSVLLTLGNAPAVRVEVDGEPVRLPTGGTRVVREFRIDRSSVETGVAVPAVPGA